MNEKNFDYLKKQLLYTGFGDSFSNELKDKMQKNTTGFLIYRDGKFGNDTVFGDLHFTKSNKSDLYFFKKYDLVLKPENNSEIKQSFYINKHNNITIKEAYNLMSGRAVNKDLTNKEGQVYNAWVQMDFKETDKNDNYKLKQFHTNYGFDLEKELAKHPIKELTNEPDKTRLIESLNKGNLQSATFKNNDNEQKVFIEANPRFKTLNIYDSNLQRIQSQSQKEKNTPEQSLTQDAKRENQKQANDDGEGIPAAKQKLSRKKGQSIS